MKKQNISEIIKFLELIKGVTKTTENKTKQIKGQLLGMSLGNLEAISLRNILMIKGVITSG